MIKNQRKERRKMKKGHTKRQGSKTVAIKRHALYKKRRNQTTGGIVVQKREGGSKILKRLFSPVIRNSSKTALFYLEFRNQITVLRENRR